MEKNFFFESASQISIICRPQTKLDSKMMKKWCIQIIMPKKLAEKPSGRPICLQFFLLSILAIHILCKVFLETLLSHHERLLAWLSLMEIKLLCCACALILACWVMWALQEKNFRLIALFTNPVRVEIRPFGPTLSTADKCLQKCLSKMTRMVARIY